MQGQQSDTKDRKLFIGGLNHDTIEKTLQGHFEQWGEVTDCVIMKDGVGRSRGFGFITYKEPSQLQNAQRNGVHVIDNKEVDAKLAVPKDYEQVDTNRDQLRKLFIGGLNYDTTVEGLRDYFARFGEIVDCNVMKDGDGRSRGFGFVSYDDVSQLDEAQRNRPHTIDGKEVETKRAMPKDSGENNMTVTKMFVGGLKEDSTEEMVREVFSEFGQIDYVDILKDKSTSRPRGFCFVGFKDYDSVDRAVLRKWHDLNGVKVEVRKAVGKDQMSARGPSGPGGYGRGRDRWMDGPPRNFSNGRGRFNRGGGDGFGHFGSRRGGGGRGGYNNNFRGFSGGGVGRGGYNNFGGGGGSGNFGNSAGGFGNFPGGDGGSNYGPTGADNSNYGGPGFGGGSSYGGSGSGGQYGGSGTGGNYSQLGGGGGNYGGPGGDVNSNFSGGSGGVGGINSFDGSNNNSGGGFNSYGGGSGTVYPQQQQQQWPGSTGNYNDNSGNNLGGNMGGGFGNNYNNEYSGGPVKSGSGYTSRSQGPYGGGYGAGGSVSNRGNSSGGSGWR